MRLSLGLIAGCRAERAAARRASAWCRSGPCGRASGPASCVPWRARSRVMKPPVRMAGRSSGSMRTRALAIPWRTASVWPVTPPPWTLIVMSSLSCNPAASRGPRIRLHVAVAREVLLGRLVVDGHLAAAADEAHTRRAGLAASITFGVLLSCHPVQPSFDAAQAARFLRRSIVHPLPVGVWVAGRNAGAPARRTP